MIYKYIILSNYIIAKCRAAALREREWQNAHFAVSASVKFRMNDEAHITCKLSDNVL